jgi:RimJ/RimL family protein N-acetyltransferase
VNEYEQDKIPQETDPQTGLPIGPLMDNTASARVPERVTLDGQYCRLDPLDPSKHGAELYAASTPGDAAARYQYLMEPAPASLSESNAWAQSAASSTDPLYFAVIDKRTGRVEGRQSYLRITPVHQVIEIGNIYWGPAIAGSQVATEANYLFAKYAFEVLGYRRYEWKCNALNAPSRKAAKRFGFRYEGHFRRAVIVQGRSRDTSWFAMIDEDWPALKAAYEQWLEPGNFDIEGNQLTRLSDLTATCVER